MSGKRSRMHAMEMLVVGVSDGKQHVHISLQEKNPARPMQSPVTPDKFPWSAYVAYLFQRKHSKQIWTAALHIM